MEIDWTTFVLEVVNFLALVWILKRFLYRPVLEVLARRRAGVEQTLEVARQSEVRAAELKSQFENRLADWEREKAALRAGLEAELVAERTRQQQALTQALTVERERQGAQEAHRQGRTAARTGGPGDHPGRPLRHPTTLQTGRSRTGGPPG